MTDDVRPTAQAVMYLRVSTREQAERDGDPEGYSIPAQRDACLRKAELLKASVAAEFVDRGESARSANRPELQRLLDYLAAHPTSYVIVHKVDRLARSRADDVAINLAIQKAGATLVSVTENIDETPSGMLLHGIMSSIAEFYSRNLASEVLKGAIKKAESGGTNGRAPVGYTNIIRRDELGREVRTVELDPVPAALMRFAFQAYASGEWTTRTLLAELTGRGLKTRPTKNRPGQPLVKSHFVRLLHNPYYKGVVRYRGVEYPGRHEPLIDADTWQLVQDVLHAQNYAGEKRRVHHHYLKGSVFCGQCGSRLIVTVTKNRHGNTYEYFMCLGRQQKRTNCTQRAMLIERVEALVEDHYATILLRPDEQDNIRKLVTADIGNRAQSLVAEKTWQAQRRTQLLDERQKLLHAHYAGAIPLDLLTTEQKQITHELAAAELRLGDVEERLTATLQNLDDVLELAADCHRAYRVAEDRIKRQFNQVFFTGLFVSDDDTVRSELAAPFARLLDVRDQWRLDPSEDLMVDVNNADGIFEEVSDHVSRQFTTNKPAASYEVAGLKMNYLVELRGLEPLTPSLRTRCATSCATAPDGRSTPREPAENDNTL
jgi:site-specific DNA recombinase